MENAKIMKASLAAAGYEVFGGVNAPYIWVKTKNGMKSWEFFDKLLNEANVVGTPGSGFGPAGERPFSFFSFCRQGKCAGSNGENKRPLPGPLLRRGRYI